MLNRMATLNGSPATSQALEQLALTNYGHFTSMRLTDGAVPGLSLHLERLRRDCQAVFGAELDTDEVRRFVRQAVGDHERAVTARVTIYDPALGLGNIADDATPHVLVTTRPAGTMPPPPLTAKTSSFSRDSAEIKHIGLFSQLRLRREAQREGYDDVIFVEPDGQVSEGATWNLGLVTEGGTVVWPSAPVLLGVTMQLLQAAHEDTLVAPVSLADLPTMRAAFATNVSIGVRAVTRIDDVEFDGNDPTLETLRKVYAELPGETL